MDERVKKLFKDESNELYKKVLDRILDFVRDSEIVKISDYNLSLDDVIKRLNDESYLKNVNVGVIKDEIKILLSTSEFWEDIKKYINSNVKELSVPLSLIRDDLSFLSNFPKLEKLSLTGYNLLSKEELDALSNTSIKEVDATMYSFTYESLLNEPDTLLVGGEFGVLIYKGLVIRDTVKKLENNTNDYIRIKVSSLNKDNLEKLYSIINTSGLEEVIIETSTNDEYNIYLEKDGSVNLVIKGNVLDVKKFYDYFDRNNMKVNSIKIVLNDENIYDKDYSFLEEISDNVSVLISYPSAISDATLEEFTLLQESVKWYRSLLTDDLSPVEKLMYVYDILKTFQYKNSNFNVNSRDPHRIMLSGSIVCRGYAALFNEIINGIDDGISSIECGVDTYDKDVFLGGHSRNAVRVDDDKYGIHGLFVLDATWDSVKTDKDSLDILGENYNALDLYRYFLIPYNDYAKTFGNDSIPDIFNKEYYGYFKGMKKLFGENVTEDMIDKYQNVCRPKLDDFVSMLYNVRVREGYSKEEALNEVKRVVDINKMVIERANNDGKGIQFFQEEIHRKSA